MLSIHHLGGPVVGGPLIGYQSNLSHILQVTFVASKSLSGYFEKACLEQQDKIWDIHRAAVETSLKVLIDDDDHTQALAVEHDRARNGECMLHTHVVLLSGVDKQRLFRMREEADRIYHRQEDRLTSLLVSSELDQATAPTRNERSAVRL